MARCWHAAIDSGISETFGIELSLLTIFDHPTLAGMSGEIEVTDSAKIDAVPNPQERNVYAFSYSHPELGCRGGFESASSIQVWRTPIRFFSCWRRRSRNQIQFRLPGQGRHRRSDLHNATAGRNRLYRHHAGEPSSWRTTARCGKQMLFMDASAHTRLRGLASKAFTPARVEQLRGHIGEIVDRLLDGIEPKGSMDVIAEFAEPLPAIVTAELLGVPVSDWKMLKAWSANFAEMLGNFQHNPEHAPIMLQTVEEMTSYFREAVREITVHPREGLIHSLITAEIDGDRLTEEEVIANSIVTMVGGQETTTNLIGNGLLTLLRNPGEMERLNGNLALIPSALEEMLRYESPSQHTARLAPSDRQLGGKQIQKRQAVIAVMAAANRDPERFPDPDRFDIARTDNRHLALWIRGALLFWEAYAGTSGRTDRIRTNAEPLTQSSAGAAAVGVAHESRAARSHVVKG